MTLDTISAMNNILNRPLSEMFAPEEADYKEPMNILPDRRLTNYMDNPLELSILRDYLVREGLGASPELQQIDAAIAAQEGSDLAALLQQEQVRERHGVLAVPEPDPYSTQGSEQLDHRLPARVLGLKLGPRQRRDLSGERVTQQVNMVVLATGVVPPRWIGIEVEVGEFPSSLAARLNAENSPTEAMVSRHLTAKP